VGIIRKGAKIANFKACVRARHGQPRRRLSSVSKLAIVGTRISLFAGRIQSDSNVMV